MSSLEIVEDEMGRFWRLWDGEPFSGPYDTYDEADWEADDEE